MLYHLGKKKKLATRREQIGIFKPLTQVEPQVRMMRNQGTSSRHDHQETRAIRIHKKSNMEKSKQQPINPDRD